MKLDIAASIVERALTPIFFLAGLATLLNVFTVRLGRIADHVDRLTSGEDVHEHQLAHLRLRSRILDGAVVFGALSGVLTCAAALTLFVGTLGGSQAGATLLALFGGALASAITALGLFVAETLLSGRSVREESRSGPDAEG